MRKLAMIAAVLMVVLSAMATTTTPAQAQDAASDQYSPSSAGAEEVSATGVLKVGLPADVLGDGTHSITDESTNTLYALRSAGPDLDAYVDQPVTVYGTLTPGEDLPNSNGIANSTLPSIDVTGVEPAEGVPGAETVRITFRLSLEGAVPEGEVFGVDYPVGGQQPADVPLCTSDPAIVGPAGPLCESGGVYEGVAEVPAGEPVEFAFQRFASGENPENFYADTQTFTEDAVVEASYSFSGEPAQPTTEVFRGIAGNVSETGMQVEDPEDPVCAYRLSFAEAGTKFFVRRDSEDVPITISDINNGDYVEFTLTLGPNEAIPSICPPPVLSPDTVVVLEDNTPDPGNTPGGTTEAPSGYDEGPDTAPGSTGSGPDQYSDKGSTGTDSTSADGGGDGAGLAVVTDALGETVDVLPDTGGPLLPVIAGAALVSAGGLLAYRRLRR